MLNCPEGADYLTYVLTLQLTISYAGELTFTEDYRIIFTSTNVDELLPGDNYRKFHLSSP